LQAKTCQKPYAKTPQKTHKKPHKNLGQKSFITKQITTMNQDLFDDYENLPKNLLDILNKYQENEDLNYFTIEKMLKEVNNIGYTFEYYLDCIPYNLQKTFA
jgi:hypothetical protein